MNVRVDESRHEESVGGFRIGRKLGHRGDACAFNDHLSGINAPSVKINEVMSKCWHAPQAYDQFSSMTRALGISLVCSALPQLVAIVLCISWLERESQWLLIAGIIAIYGGLALLLVSAIALLRHFVTASPRVGHSNARRWLSTAIGAAVLGANFPVAGVCMVLALDASTWYSVVIENASPHPLTEARIVGGGCDQLVGTIAVGERVAASMHIQHDGTLSLLVRCEGATSETVLDTYVTNGLGGGVHARVGEGCVITVTREPRH